MRKIKIDYQKMKFKWRFFLLDSRRLQQILINLISNAIKFSHQESTIYLDCRIFNKFPLSNIQISVRDCGIGIEERYKAQLFKRFNKSQSKTAQKMNPNAIGLGLYVSMNIA